ncbi:MAG: ABC transporter ATP-binding protein/permease [Bacilli bacterium]|nr:ABC transporter ATP-binding protein/permease [Bacilli bacterium]
MARKPLSAKESKGTLKRLFSYIFKYYKFEFWMGITCILVSTITGVIPALLTGQIVDQLDTALKTMNEYIKAGNQIAATNTMNEALAYIGIEILIVVGIILVGLTCNYFYQILMSKLGQGTMKKIRDDLFNHMQDLPLSYFDTRTRGDLMSIYTNDVDTLREAISRSLPMLVQSSFTMIVVLVSMFIRSWALAIAVIVLVIPTVLISKTVSGKSGKYFISRQAAMAKTNGYVEEMINGQKVIKVFNYEKRAKAGFDKVNDELCYHATKASRYASLLMPIVNQLGNLQYVIIAIIGAGIIVSGGASWTNITVGTIVTFLSLSKQFTQPIGNLAQQASSVFMAMAGSARIFALIDTPAEKDEGYVELCNAIEGKDGEPIECQETTGKWAWKHPHGDGTITYTWLKGDITFTDVDFSYVPGKPILKNISLYAKPGQKVAFVGPTGAGKTTITNLINRFYDIEDGKIRYDGININKIKKKDLRRSLGMVLQDTVLFTGTVKENIRYGRLDATDEEVEAAAKLANADSFIRQLPNGYDTVLDKAGMNLSQGQRQLLSIARAAIANPPAMILDEATSSIDSRTEKLVQEGMDAIMKGRTVFVIAHRLSTVKDSDVIMVIDDGEIIERGNHDELIAKKGKYYQLYTGNSIK